MEAPINGGGTSPFALAKRVVRSAMDLEEDGAAVDVDGDRVIGAAPGAMRMDIFKRHYSCKKGKGRQEEKTPKGSHLTSHMNHLLSDDWPYPVYFVTTVEVVCYHKITQPISHTGEFVESKNCISFPPICVLANANGCAFSTCTVQYPSDLVILFLLVLSHMHNHHGYSRKWITSVLNSIVPERYLIPMDLPSEIVICIDGQ